MTQIQPTPIRSKVVVFCAFVSITLSLTVLAGWSLDIAALKSILPDFPEMKPNTAIAFGIAGLGLVCVSTFGRSDRWSNAAVICGVLVYLIGAVTLGEYITGSSIGTDTMLVPVSGAIPGHQFSGHMSPHSAFSFTLLGTSLIFLNGGRRSQKISAFLAFSVSLTTLAAILGYLYQAEYLFGIPKHNNMALHTIALFVLSSFGLLAANSDSNTLKMLTSDSLGGTSARKLLPAVILIPTIVGWLWVLGQERGFYDPGFGAALSIFFSIVLMCGIVLFFSAAVHKTDRRRKRVEQELTEKEQRYRELFDYGQSMICIHDLEGILVTVNPATLSSLGYESGSMVGRSLREFLPVEHQAEFDAYLRQVENEGLASGFLALATKDGKQVIWRYQNILVSEPEKEPYVLGHAQDVTALIDAQTQLKNLSLRDELTGLYNRRGFLTLAEQQIKLERHERTARGLTLMFADMDGLKRINDVYGHEVGSDAIKELSKIFSSALRDSDLVARWGGDEFVVLAIGSQDADAELITERISRMISEYNAIGVRPYELACSIGVAPIPLDDNRSFESILAEADDAMYAEKRRRKATRENLAERQFVPPAQTNALPALDLSNRGPLA